MLMKRMFLTHKKEEKAKESITENVLPSADTNIAIPVLNSVQPNPENKEITASTNTATTKSRR